SGFSSAAADRLTAEMAARKRTAIIAEIRKRIIPPEELRTKTFRLSKPRSVPLFLRARERRPEAGIADATLVYLVGVLFYGRFNRRCPPNQHKHEIIQRKMFIDDLLRDGRGYRIDARFQLVDLVVTESIILVDYNPPHKL